VFVVVMALVTASSGQQPGESGPATTQPSRDAGPLPALNERAEIRIDVRVLPTKKALVRGRTNLPEGTELMVSVEEPFAGGFRGQSKCTVGARGTFEAGPFGPDGGLPQGFLKTEVMMPLPMVQPKSVRTAIGERGENLKGPQVEGDELGVTLRVETPFVVGGPDALKKQRERVERELKSCRETYQQCRKLQRSLVSARKKKLDEVKRAAFVRDMRSKLDELRKVLGQPRPGSPGFLLAVAVGDLEMMLLDVAFDKDDSFKTQERLLNEMMTKGRKSMNELERFLRDAEKTAEDGETRVP
jgi:hypothetical protein